MAKSAPRLKQHDNGRWYVCWTENDVPKSVSTRTRNLVAAEAFKKQWIELDQAETEAENTGAVLTFEELWQVYFDNKIAGGPSAYHVGYDQKNILAYFGELTVPRINREAVKEYLRRRTSGLLGRRVKPQTVRKELQQVIACLHFCSAEEHGHELFDPALIRHIKLPKAGAPRDRWLTRDEIDRLLTAANATRAGRHGHNRMTRIERFVWLAIETAGRVQALLDLTWDRVDFDVGKNGVIHLHDPNRPATKKRRPSVPISDRLLPVLRRMKEEATTNYVLDHASRHGIWECLQKAVRRAGLDTAGTVNTRHRTGIGPHVLRHTAATLMARDGVPLWQIANILGNTLAMVDKVYAKWQPQGMEDAVNRITGPAIRPVERQVS